MEARMEMAPVVAHGDCSVGEGSCSTLPSRFQNRNRPCPAWGAGPLLHAELNCLQLGRRGSYGPGQTIRDRPAGTGGEGEPAPGQGESLCK